MVLKSFKAKLQVPNYSIAKTPPEDLARLEQIKTQRRAEMREFRIRKLEVCIEVRGEGREEERSERVYY